MRVVMHAVVDVNLERGCVTGHDCLSQSRRAGSVSGRVVCFFFQAEDGIRDDLVTGVQTCALPILKARSKISCCARQTASVMPSRSLRSAPAQNARSPAPVSTTQRALPGSAASLVQDRKSVV